MQIWNHIRTGGTRALINLHKIKFFLKIQDKIMKNEELGMVYRLHIMKLIGVLFNHTSSCNHKLIS